MADNHLQQIAYCPKQRVFSFNHDKQANEIGDPQQDGQGNAQRYYHITTPITKKSCVMYRFDLEGYSYGQGVPLDLVWVGYTYTDETIHKPNLYNRNKDIIDLQMKQYFRGSNLVISFGPIDRYCNGFSIYYQGHYSNQTLGLQTDKYSIIATSTPDQLE